MFHRRINCKSLVGNSSHSSFDHIHLHQQIMESNKYFSNPFCIFCHPFFTQPLQQNEEHWISSPLVLETFSISKCCFFSFRYVVLGWSKLQLIIDKERRTMRVVCSDPITLLIVYSSQCYTLCVFYGGGKSLILFFFNRKI